MKHLLKKLALLAIPLVLYLAFFVSFEPNNYFGLRAGAASTAPIARVRAFEENPGDYLLLGDSRLAHFDMDLAAEVSGKPWQNLAFGGASLRETLDLAEYALAQNPGVKELVLGLSFYTLNQSYDTDRMSDLQATLRNPAAYVLNLEYNVNTLTSFVNWTIWARQRLAGTTDDTWAQAQVERETGDWEYPADYTAPDGSLYPVHAKLAQYPATIYPVCQGWQLNQEQFDRLLEFAARCEEKGVEVTVESHDSATRDQMVNDGNYQFALVGNGGWGNNPPTYMRTLFSDTAKFTGTSPIYMGAIGYSNPEMTALAEGQMYETDFDARVALFRELELLVSQEIPIFVIANQSTYSMYRTDYYDGWMKTYAYQRAEQNRLSYMAR